MDTADRASFIDNITGLIHYGKKGMRWGVTTLPDGTQVGNPKAAVKVKEKPGKAVKTSGGKERSASEDAIAAKVGKQIAKKSSTDALSNAELQAVVTRMQLEQNFIRLETQQKSLGRSFIQKYLTDKKTRANTKDLASDAASLARQAALAKQVGDAIKKGDMTTIGK